MTTIATTDFTSVLHPRDPPPPAPAPDLAVAEKATYPIERQRWFLRAAECCFEAEAPAG